MITLKMPHIFKDVKNLPIAPGKLEWDNYINFNCDYDSEEKTLIMKMEVKNWDCPDWYIDMHYEIIRQINERIKEDLYKFIAKMDGAIGIEMPNDRTMIIDFFKRDELVRLLRDGEIL